MTALDDIYEVIARLRKATKLVDADDLAGLVMNDIQCVEPWRSVFFPLVSHACADAIRSGVRSVEKSQNMPRPSATADPVALRERFLQSGFMTGSKYVTWADAASEDHAERIEMLAKMRDGLNGTIKRHQWAIEMIAVKKVKCLGQIADLRIPQGAAA